MAAQDAAFAALARFYTEMGMSGEEKLSAVELSMIAAETAEVFKHLVRSVME